MKTLNLKTAIVLSAPCLIYILSNLTYYMFYSRLTCEVENFFHIISFFGLIYPVLYFIITGYCLAFMKTKFYILIPFLFALALPFLLLFPTNNLRMKAMARASEKGSTVVSEIEKYKSSNGAFPKELTYLNLESYHTGLCQYPSYTYSSSESGNSFNISILVGQGLLNWDELVYKPGADNEFGDWDYIFE